MEMTRRELFNARQASTSLKDMIGKDIIVKKTGIDVKTVDGQDREVCYLIDKDGHAYSTISDVFSKGMKDLEEIVMEEGEAKIVIKSSKSKSGRDFIYGELV